MEKEKVYLFNLRMCDLQDIIRLVVSDSIDIEAEGYDKRDIMITGYDQEASPYNGFHSGKFIQIDVPLNSDINGYRPRFEIKIYEDGFISYENGSGSKMYFPNSLEVYRILLSRMG